MANTLPNITIPTNQWVDLYLLSGVTVGVAISVENVGCFDVFLAVQAAQPPATHNAFNIIKRSGDALRNSNGDAGAWAFSQGSQAKVNVRPIA